MKFLMIKLICIKDYFSKNLPTYKVHSIGNIYNLEIIGKNCKLYTEDNGFYSFDIKNLEKYFISMAKYREQQINSILYE